MMASRRNKRKNMERRHRERALQSKRRVRDMTRRTGQPEY